MVVVDSSYLTLYVTVDLSGILSARGYIYVCILHIITIEGALCKKNKPREGLGNVFVCGQLVMGVSVSPPLHLDTHICTNIRPACTLNTHLHMPPLNSSSILLSFFQLSSTFYEFSQTRYL